MNREILSRGKRKDNGEWVEGWAFPFTNGGYAGKDNRMCIRNGMYAKDIYEVDPDTVGQYIGKKDRNKKLLFEGDIIRFKQWRRGDICWVGVISYDYCSFIVKGGPNKEIKSPFELQMSGIEDTWCERIGNIYDNPELLDGGKNGA